MLTVEPKAADGKTLKGFSHNLPSERTNIAYIDKDFELFLEISRSWALCCVDQSTEGAE
jgi:hypothetical protein